MSRLASLLCSADDAVGRIADGATVVCGGFVGAAHPEALTAAIERRFQRSGTPRGLTLVYAAGQGDGDSRGLNHLGHEGLLARVIGGHWGLVPKISRLAIDGRIAAYNFPQGVICQLLRDIAAARPGCVTHVGLGTFIDPRHAGGRLNDVTPPGLVELLQISGREWLLYKSFPVDVGLIRATAADENGNLIMDREAIIGEVLAIAQAVRNSGGRVIAQVREILEGPAPPMSVRVPGILVDHVVVADSTDHQQTFAEDANSTYYSPRSVEAIALEPLPPGPRRIIAARACDELESGAIVNLGIGMPEGIARIAAERGLLQQVTLTVESGPIGGMPAGGLSFGASVHPAAIIDQPAQFDFYDGGGLDFAALGAAQIDQHGNVNVSRFGDRVAGVGGFVNISQSARRLVFCGTLTSSGLEVQSAPGRLEIMREGTVQKFVDAVEQISFSGAVARQARMDVLYVTERAVFRLTPDGVELIEVAPGIDMESQVIGRMGFRPLMGEVRLMPDHVFAGPDHV